MLNLTPNTYNASSLAKNDYLTRRHSFSVGDAVTFTGNIKEINNSPTTFMRNKSIADLTPVDNNNTLHSLAKIKYNKTLAANISSKNYVYCGMATMLPVNSLGMSIDNDGHLVLIKGKQYDLFKGLLIKNTSGYQYKTAQLINDKCDIRFKELYINDDGLLIGVDRNTEKSHSIEISAPETNINTSEQFVNLNFSEYSKNNKIDELAFKTDENTSSSYFCKNGKIYLKSIQKEKSIKDYSFMQHEIKIPLPSGFSVKGIKKSMGFLQIDTSNGKKGRVFFINPKHISNRKLSVSRISHKPPQSFSSRLGNDPHEKYHAGLPFTSDRKANFSSTMIPLFSSIIDNFRTHIKRSKSCSAEGLKKRTLIHAAKAIDPGVGGIYATVSAKIRAASGQAASKIKNKGELYDRNINILGSPNHPLSRVVDTALKIEPELKTSESLLHLAKQIKPKEAIHLTRTDRIAAFFGISSGGVPFAPGWFAGVVGELSSSHNLTISKTETGNIRLSFSNRHKSAATGLAGTGQGLEKTILNAADMDFMTIMPFEANAIIAAKCISGNDFSFDLREEDFYKFATQFTHPQKKSGIKNIIISKSEAEKIKEKEFIIKIEAKSELRLQAGRMADASTYMVMPRTAVGARLAVELLNLKSKTSKSVSGKENAFSAKKKNIKITTLSHDANLFAEWKIMPVAMHQAENGMLLCHPLPLLEENKPLSKTYSQDGLTLVDTLPARREKSTPDNVFHNTKNISIVDKTPMFITINGKEEIKKILSLKKMAMVDKRIGLVSETIENLRKTLLSQERDSQNKACVINVISHYELIPDTRPPLNEPNSAGSPERTIHGADGKRSYRLKKLEFRRVSSLQLRQATIPLPILSFSSTNGITYDQHLGEIDFQYNNSDMSPVSVRRKLATLY
ncbi:hypothetical protein [Cedecea davisae]|uniref:hypothetical protein n=1 Tax=Cedecea davisae TaxID=158484 RepID=UPI001D09B772|nr:hypothetical protein [Cedecea davisae]